MLIGLDASRANRKFKSGTEWYSYHLIKELAAIDSANQYVLYSDQPLNDDLAEVVRGHGNFRAKVLNWPLTYFWTQIRLSLEMLFQPPDLLFVPAHALPLLHPRKSLVTIHDIGFERERGLYRSDKIGPAGLTGKIFDYLARIFTLGKFGAATLDYQTWSTKFALKHASRIIAVSNFTKQELIKVYRAAGDKIAVVYNGYNDAIYKKITDQGKINQVLNKYGIKRPYIFYVGRLEKKKNTPALVNAFAIMKARHKELEHKLVLAGQASLGFAEVKYVAEEFNLLDEIILTGWVPEADLPYIYNGAALFVFPSHYEGFGIPLVEAMACGAPIVASAIAPLKEVADGAALFFNPSDKHDLAEKMAEALLDENCATELVARGLARVKDFSLVKCARETLAVLESIFPS